MSFPHPILFGAAGPLAATKRFPDQLVGEDEPRLGDLGERQQHLRLFAFRRVEPPQPRLLAFEA